MEGFRASDSRQVCRHQRPSQRTSFGNVRRRSLNEMVRLCFTTILQRALSLSGHGWPQKHGVTPEVVLVTDRSLHFKSSCPIADLARRRGSCRETLLRSDYCHLSPPRREAARVSLWRHLFLPPPHEPPEALAEPPNIGDPRSPREDFPCARRCQCGHPDR